MIQVSKDGEYEFLATMTCGAIIVVVERMKLVMGIL